MPVNGVQLETASTFVVRREGDDEDVFEPMSGC